MTQPVFETTATALREKSKLQRHFRRFDVFFYLICTVVTIDTIGAVASNGAQGFRTEAVAADDGGGPRVLGRFSARFGTPVAMNLLSGLVATVLMIAAFQITGADSSRYFAAVLGLTISTTTISYLFIFPALVKLRYSRPDMERPYRVPGGVAGAWICSVVPTFWALLATVALIWPGFGVNWFGGGGNPRRHGDDLLLVVRPVCVCVQHAAGMALAPS